MLELGTGFCQTFKQFLAVRALFGIAMGGLYGNAAATALEDCPEAARGIISGMLQQGYAFGYLLATAFARALVNTTPHGWRPLFWFGACPPVLIILFRLCLPETNTFRARQAVREQQGSLAATFISEGRVALRRHYLLLVYLIVLMAMMNFLSHGSENERSLDRCKQAWRSPSILRVFTPISTSFKQRKSMGYTSAPLSHLLSI